MRESEACGPLEISSFGFPIYAFPFPQECRRSYSVLEMADPKSTAVREEGSRAASGAASGLTLVNDSLPSASSKE